jgi:MFS family permease
MRIIGHPAEQGGADGGGETMVAPRPRWPFDKPDFRRLWLIGLVAFGVRWLEMLVVGVFVYQETGSPFLVAMMTLLRLLPMALFGALLGAFAERLERRTALIVSLSVMLLAALVIAALAHAGQLAVWHLAAASFANGVAWASDNPVRRVMMGEVVGPAGMGAAMAIDVGANNASRMLGPTIGGLLLVGLGIDGAFLVSVGCYAVALVTALRVRYRNRPTIAPPAPVLVEILDGLRLARRDRSLCGTLLITVVFNVFGWPFTSMIPVIGQDSLALSPQGIGVLASMDGIGAFCGALAIALFAKPANYLRLYVGGVACYLVMIIMFALMPLPALAGAALLATGLSSSCFSIMQATLVYLAAPPEMRSRIYGVLTVCIGMGPLGFLHLGLLSSWIGAPSAVIVSAAEGLVVLALTQRWWRVIGAPPPLTSP